MALCQFHGLRPRAGTHVDGFKHGHDGRTMPLGQDKTVITSALGIDMTFKRGRCGRENNRNFLDLSAHHRHVARMIDHAFFLLIGGIMFFIDNDEPEFGKG